MSYLFIYLLNESISILHGSLITPIKEQYQYIKHQSKYIKRQSNTLPISIINSPTHITSQSQQIKTHTNTPSINNITPKPHTQHPFPLEFLPYPLRCIVGVDFTYHHHLYHSFENWIASIISLLQLLVASSHLKIYLSLLSPWFIKNIFKLLHATLVAEHIGEYKTLYCIKLTFFWPKLSYPQYYPKPCP